MIEQVNQDLAGALSIGEFGARTPVKMLGVEDGRRKFADPMTGETAFRAELPENWQATKLEIDPTQAYGSWPFTVFFEAQDGNGSLIRYRSAWEWVQSDQSQLAMARQMGMPAAPNERFFENEATYLDGLAAAQVRGHEASLRFLGEFDWPVQLDKRVSDETATEQLRAVRTQVVEQMNQMSRANGAMSVVSLDDAGVHSLCRLYAFDWDDAEYRLALFTSLQYVRTSMRPEGFKAGMGGNGGGQQQGGLMERIGNAAQGATRAFGADGAIANAGRKLQDAMFGHRSDQGWAQQQSSFGGGAPVQQPVQQQQPQQQFGGLTTVEWGDMYLFALIAPAGAFDGNFSNAFTPFCSTASVDVSIGVLKDQLAMKRMQEQQAEFERRQREAFNAQPKPESYLGGQPQQPNQQVPFGQGASQQAFQQPNQPPFGQQPQFDQTQQPNPQPGFGQQPSQQPGFGFGQQPQQPAQTQPWIGQQTPQSQPGNWGDLLS